MQEKVTIPEVDRMKETRTAPPYRPHCEQEPPREVIKTAACEVVCGLHLAAGVFMMLFVDVAEQWPLLLMAILYCFLGGSSFGIMASVERYAEEIEGGEER